jgi:hypothetical protein
MDDEASKGKVTTGQGRAAVLTGAGANGRAERRCDASTSAWKSCAATVAAVGLLERTERERARKGSTIESEK